jgi:hypothetical protein
LTPTAYRKFRVILATALAVTVGPGLAQPAQGPFRAPASRSETPAPGSLREAPAPPAPGSLYIVEKPGNTLLATEYLGRAVQGPDKQKVGTINDLLVDTTGRIIGVVIDVGGFLGIGGKEIAIAFEALFPVFEDGKEAFLVEMSRNQLAAAPAFKRPP